VWNEPNLIRWNNWGDDAFFALYRATWTVVKGVHRGLAFGMPSIAWDSEAHGWIARFYARCRQYGCPPDFNNIHYYDNDFTEKNPRDRENALAAMEQRRARPLKLHTDENAFRKAITEIRAAFDSVGAGGAPLYMTEWNMTVSQRNLLNDTCFKACYLAKNILENCDRLDSFGYWVLTDLIEETQPSNEQFHGGLGLLTHSGVKKSSYHVFSFLNRLGNRLIRRGDGFFITKSQRGVQMILYNYEHFSHLFASGETFDMSFAKRYAPFSNLTKLSVSLKLSDLPGKAYVVREHILNLKYGSAFDVWVEMGASGLAPCDVDYLKRVSVPKLLVREEETPRGVLDVTAELEPLEVRLIELTALDAVSQRK
jgi:xylan 1,4-beta-xylosidase